MASSPIRINEATIAELQQLPSIGPKRAERIVRYREEVSPIQGPGDLASIAGISEARARETSQLIDFSRRRRPMVANLIIAACAGIAGISLYHYAIQGYSLAAGGPAPSLYFVCVFMILLGSFATIVRQLLQSQAMDIPGPGWVAVCSLASGAILLSALIIATASSSVRDDFTAHVLATGELATFVAIIVVLIYGPGWYVQSRLRHFDHVAILFDYGQPGLAIATLLLLSMRDKPSLIETLFGIWTGVTLLINSREMARGRSSYVSSLSERELARLAFFASNISTGTHSGHARRLLRPVGWLLAVLSFGLVVQTIRILTAKY